MIYIQENIAVLVAARLIFIIECDIIFFLVELYVVSTVKQVTERKKIRENCRIPLRAFGVITAVYQLGAIEDEAIHPENIPVITALYVSYAAVVALFVSNALEILRTVKRCAAIKQKRDELEPHHRPVFNILWNARREIPVPGCTRITEGDVAFLEDIRDKNFHELVKSLSIVNGSKVRVGNYLELDAKALLQLSHENRNKLIVHCGNPDTSIAKSFFAKFELKNFEPETSLAAIEHLIGEENLAQVILVGDRNFCNLERYELNMMRNVLEQAGAPLKRSMVKVGKLICQKEGCKTVKDYVRVFSFATYYVKEMSQSSERQLLEVAIDSEEAFAGQIIKNTVLQEDMLKTLQDIKRAFANIENNPTFVDAYAAACHFYKHRNVGPGFSFEDYLNTAYYICKNEVCFTAWTVDGNIKETSYCHKKKLVAIQHFDFKQRKGVIATMYKSNSKPKCHSNLNVAKLTL